MATIVTRQGKGSKLTIVEMDDNFENLNTQGEDNTTAINTLGTSKQDTLGFVPVPNSRTVNDKPLTTNIALAKADVGLSAVDNTSDAAKPISTATQTALDTKASTAALSSGLALKANTTYVDAELATKATPDDIDTALEDSQIFFDQNTFQGAVYPVPVPPQPAVGTAGNPIKAIGSGVVVDVVENGNTNAVSSNAVFQNTSTLRGGYTGSLQDLYDLIVSGNVTPAAPTDFIVDNTLNTAGFTPNPLITDLSEYEYQILSGTITTVTANPFSVGDIDAPIGTVKVRIKAASGRNPSQWLVNETAYTAGAGSGINPLIFASMDSDVDVDAGTNTYTTISSDTFDNKIWDSGKRLLADTDGAIYLQDSAGAVLGFASSNIGTYYGNMVIGMWHTNGNELFAVENGQSNAFIEAILAGWDYRVNRTTTVHTIQRSNDSWATNTTVHTFVYTGTGILYPAGDIHSTGSELVNPRYSDLNNV